MTKTLILPLRPTGDRCSVCPLGIPKWVVLEFNELRNNLPTVTSVMLLCDDHLTKYRQAFTPIELAMPIDVEADELPDDGKPGQ